jgi:8-oxo-dGTP pyrophosphatase MutT (NUDIX family)
MKIKRPESAQPIPKDAKKVFSGVLFDVYQWEQKQFDGTYKTFEKLSRPDNVTIFPVLDDGKILLSEQNQPGRINGFIDGFGGKVEEGENALDAAKRELLEESGYEASKYILWKTFQPATKIDWVVYIFIVKGLKKVSKKNLDSGEKIKFKPVTLEEFISIASTSSFVEKGILPELLEAKLDSKKYKELKKLFKSIK